MANTAYTGRSLAERSARLFRFYKGTSEFFPGAGTSLHFENRGVDTLSLRDLPSGFLAASDSVSVDYYGTGAAVTVFRGTVEKIVETTGRGDDATQDAVASGPWSALDRLVFLQRWLSLSGGSVSYNYTSGLVLNQDEDGSAIGWKTQLSEILAFAKTPCGFTAASLSGGVKLPFDEVRDLTCAQAVNRTLRFFPKKVVAFDYSAETPSIALRDVDTTAADAAWTATIQKTGQVRTINAHPCVGVDIEVQTSGENNEVSYRVIGHQTAGTVGAVDTLHATVQLAGYSSNQVVQIFQTETEDCPTDLADVSWWKSKHPYLANFAAADIAISTGARSGSADASSYPRIAKAGVRDIQDIGMIARVETFTATATVTHRAVDGTVDGIEEGVVLSIKFVTTNCEDGKKYRRTTSAAATTGETLPDGLAAAVLSDRSQALQTVECTARLGASLPALGDLYCGLLLQSYDVDCDQLIISCHFGQPDHLSPDDLAGLMTGFRNRRRATSGFSRASGKTEDDEQQVEENGISPIESSEFSPGVIKQKAIVGAEAKIELDPAALTANKNMGVKEVTLADGTTKVKVLADEDFTAGGGSSGPALWSYSDGAFQNCYFEYGRTIYGAASIAAASDGTYYLHVTHGTSSSPTPTYTLDTTAAANTSTTTTFKVATIANGAETEIFISCPVIFVYE